MSQHLVFVGGGHAHLTSLKNLSSFRSRGHRVTLISLSPYHYYSGMGPGLLSGIYHPWEVRFNIKKWAEDQDATFITSDPGHAKSDVPRGRESKTRRSKDGAWAKKGNKSYFGYKGHIKTDVENNFIWEVETTVANTHDSKIDLANEGEVRYGDKGYHGAKTKGYDASMKRAARGHPLSIFDELRNKRISSKRSPVERCFSVIKKVFKSGHVMVTTVERAAVKMTFNAIGYNLFNLLGIVSRKTA